MQEFGEYLIAGGVLGEEEAARAREASILSGEPIHIVSSQLGLATEDSLADAVAGFFQLDRVGRDDFPSEPILPERFQSAFLRSARVLPLQNSDGAFTLAVADPMNEVAIKSVSFAVDRKVDLKVATASDIDLAIEQLYRPLEQADAPCFDALGAADLDRLMELAAEKPVIRFVNRLIETAAELGASDIHLDPTDFDYIQRYRVDGVLSEPVRVPQNVCSGLISRIKIMAQLDIGERRLPQDGRITVATRGKPLDLRVATVPTVNGESVVLRLLDPDSMEFSLEALGFSQQAKAAYEDLISQPYGIVLVTGPTGSGKTTSLYACMDKLNTGQKKILTVEDPVEYQQAGIQQIQVNTGIGFTFASALRSVLRHDPDILMVGEIRDLETAEIAIQFALTGHPVLSTLHTNSAAASVTRLLDMGINDFLVTSAVNGIVAQRLVRKLCPHCRVPASQIEEIAHRIGGDDFVEGQFHKAVGCPQCRHTGYIGRSAIVEVLPFSRAVVASILDGESAHEIEAVAVKEGMVTLLRDGLALAARGETTLEEVLRVARMDP